MVVEMVIFGNMCSGLWLDLNMSPGVIYRLKSIASTCWNLETVGFSLKTYNVLRWTVE